MAGQLKEVRNRIKSVQSTQQKTKEFARDIKNGTKEVGRISINYGFRREFVLED